MMRHGKNMNKFKNILKSLEDKKPFDPIYKDHKLQGDWEDCRDLHIEPDWILIYRVTDDTVFLERTGTHSDLF